MKNNVLFTVLTVAALEADAQIYPTSSPDNYIASSNSNKVQNTGADYWQNSTGSRSMYLMVSDGSNPSLYWVKNSFYSGYQMALANNVTINAQAEMGDPDIVVNSSGVRALSVFIATDALNETRLYIQRYQRADQLSTFWSYLGSPVLIAQSTSDAPILCPNADITAGGIVVIVYQKTDTIWSQTINISTGLLLPVGPIPISTHFTNNVSCRQPDVSIYSPTTPLQETAYITCINDHAGTEEILVHQLPVTQLQLGVGNGNTANNIYTSNSGWLKAPRISTQWTNSNLNAFNNWGVTFTDHDPGNNTYDILAVVNYYGAISAPVLINNINAIDRQSINAMPCITYSENYIVIGWAYHDQFSQYGLNGFDILSRKLEWNGNYATNWTSNYSLVNSDNIDHQYAPSVTDCRIGNYQNGTTYFCWYQHDANYSTKIGFRRSLHSNSNLRLDQKTEKNDIRLYPNPAKNNVTLQFENSDTELTLISIYSLTGELIYEEQITSFDLSGQHTVNIESLTNGVYTFRLTRGTTIRNEILVVQQ